MKISHEQMVKAFNDWLLRSVENPEEFGECLDSEGKPEADYGELCANYFQKLVIEMGKPAPSPVPESLVNPIEGEKKKAPPTTEYV